ncbi:F-box only protein 36b isoform X2 [Electrophorus electricus]|uniref:F-box only protein 36b isoform X2 n=1 Tax=Electrophorus electricus TaxID=8005 RepID=UPI0015D0098E|nr:F-box only protein 36b isoform X2 [Electrophorus electricus]
MAKLLGETLFEISGQGPAPMKDYFYFEIRQNEVIWRWWKISLRVESRNTTPGETKESHADYLDDSRLQNLEDVARFARTCHRFKKICSSEEFWEQTVRMYCDTVTAGMEDLAKEVGWRTIFFTNKLQLQKQISRRKLKNKTPHTGGVDSAVLVPVSTGMPTDRQHSDGD